MNKAITDGLVLMPLPFAAGLGVWSSGDGTPGSDTYAVSGNGVFVAADQDFGGCLEVVKDATTNRVRYMGETPILPGCFLQVRASVKVCRWPNAIGAHFGLGRSCRRRSSQWFDHRWPSDAIDHLWRSGRNLRDHCQCRPDWCRHGLGFRVIRPFRY